MLRKGKKDGLLGSLDLLILRVLQTEAKHGYGIARRIEQVSSDVLAVQEGSLYPALNRLEKKAFIRSEWQTGESKKPIRMYILTPDGERQLEEERFRWETITAAVNTVLKEA